MKFVIGLTGELVRFSIIITGLAMVLMIKGQVMQGSYGMVQKIRAMPRYETLNQQRIIRMKEKLTIDLDIEWKDGKAEWGRFELEVLHQGLNKPEYKWGFWLYLIHEDETNTTCIDFGNAPDKESCQQACETALKKILAGVKE